MVRWDYVVWGWHMIVLIRCISVLACTYCECKTQFFGLSIVDHRGMLWTSKPMYYEKIMNLIWCWMIKCVDAELRDGGKV